MTEKELRGYIIVKMSKYADDIRIDEFCAAENITFTSDFQKKKIFRDLENSGVIKCTLHANGNGNISIPYNDLDEGFDSNDISNLGLKYFNQKNTEPLYYTKESNKKIIDNSVEPCFNVKSIAECYVDLIDRACEHGENNVCMLGIFAPWGRGKSYFFRKVKEHINSRQNSETIHYGIVEFNAWKYQETPAIWAYLFETLYNSKNWWFRTRYQINRIYKSILRDAIFFLIPTMTMITISFLKKIKDFVYSNRMISSTILIGLVSIIGLILEFMSKHCFSAISLIKRYSKGISFANELGVQAEIEKEITSLLKFWISDKEAIKKKVILYVDDIDRCSETKMTSIIDSLRTVLENEEIRKRLIIICSIDPEKIIKGIEYKYKTLYDEKEIRSIAIDQMDKIFLTGIALPQLDNDQLSEFASKLTGADCISSQSKNQQVPTNDKQSPKTNEYTTTGNRNEETIELNDNDLYNLLENRIYYNKKGITPRKIRIIYYRMLLANNIIYKRGNIKISELFFDNIFYLSIGKINSIFSLSKELCEVLNMVVPYKYKNEVKEDKKNEIAS